jgi:hypothetical protein
VIVDIADTCKLADGFANVDVITVYPNDPFEANAIGQSSNDQ